MLLLFYSLLHNGSQQLSGPFIQSLYIAVIIMAIGYIVALGLTVAGSNGKGCFEQCGTVLTKTQVALCGAGVSNFLCMAGNLAGKDADAGAVLRIEKKGIAPVEHYNVHPVAGLQKTVVAIFILLGTGTQ